MTEKKAFNTALNDEQPDDVGKGTRIGADCGVKEQHFPQVGKCCGKSITISGAVYKEICPYCSIWSSLPDRASLEIAYIFDCQQYGYGKRIKE